MEPRVLSSLKRVNDSLRNPIGKRGLRSVAKRMAEHVCGSSRRRQNQCSTRTHPSIEKKLEWALDGQEIAVYYQPKVDLRTAEIIGAETVVRWMHPTQGMISPSAFVPVAEDQRLILLIGEWILRTACSRARAWLDGGNSVDTVIVKISATEFHDERFLERVFTILDHTGLSPRFLELELTEGVLMKSAEASGAILKTLRASGVQVIVDDFGTGHSSLDCLKTFPIDALKIDQSFVREITGTLNNAAEVAAIISIGRSLNLRVVAEDVATVEQLAFLRVHHCDEAQGHYFSRPLTAKQFSKLLKTGIHSAVSTDL
jgi:diguanylate cyclase